MRRIGPHLPGKIVSPVSNGALDQGATVLARISSRSRGNELPSEGWSFGNEIEIGSRTARNSP